MKEDIESASFPYLETKGLLLREIKVIERRKQGFASGRGIRWGIARKEDNYLIGSCGFTWIPQANAAEVGYELGSQFWRQGIMSEALNAILKYAFENKQLEFVIAEIMLENVASRKLLQKLGFRSQEVLKNHGFWKGKYHDLERFIIKTDVET